MTSYRLLLLLLPFALLACGGGSNASEEVSSSSSSKGNVLHFVFTSDPHFGETRHFRGDGNVSAKDVNSALITKMNTLPAVKFPADQGVGAGDEVGAVEFVVLGGDLLDKSVLAKGDDTVAAYWKELSNSYLRSIVLQDRQGESTPLYLMAGNHDVPNSLVMAEIYNRTMNPSTPKTAGSYEYATGRVHYSFDLGGVHFVMLNIWPDATELEWLSQDLKGLPATKPVVLFAHDPAEVEPTHFSGPSALFENLLDPLLDGTTPEYPALIEERAWVQFLEAHPQVKAYFHGHNNSQEYYRYKGPDKLISLPVFRVDSPMKGQISGDLEERLSFQVISLDSVSGNMTVRECLWNSNPSNAWAPITWGQTQTISLL